MFTMFFWDVFRVRAILAGDNLSLIDMAHEGVYYGGWYGGRGTQGLQPVPAVAHPRDMLVEAFHGASSAGAAEIGQYTLCSVCFFP